MTSDEDPAEPPGLEALQFEHADFVAAPPVLACTACTQPIADAYYEIQGKVFCGRCRDRVVARFGGAFEPAGFARAVLFGSLAAVAGALLYLLVLELMKYPISLIYIVSGYMVGVAVRKGGGYRGGWQYQALAVALTYSAIVGWLIPLLVAEMMKKGVMTGANLLSVVVMACQFPVLMATRNPMGLVIVGFALVQAWRLNRKVNLPINGPFQVGGGSAPPLEITAHG